MRLARRTLLHWPRSAVVVCTVLAVAVVALTVALLRGGPASSSRGAAAVPAADGTSTPASTRASTRASSSSSVSRPTPAASGRALRPGHVSSADVSASAMPADELDVEQGMVGPLFPDGLGQNHTCTASVVASSAGDTILTAAHCISGSAKGWLFVPGYDRGKTPDGVWTVTGQYVTSQWRNSTAAEDDFAVLTVADRTIDGASRTLASVTGAEQLGTTPARGTVVRVIGYNNGLEDAATTCAVPMRLVADHPTFHCHGFVGGSSGSPWLLADAATPTVVGVIGGRHQGGCTEYTSHSSPFTSGVAALVARAARGGSPDTAPSAGSDNCPTS